jgi:ubiquinone/menaquinone biosynthesis C-methylase UbiE
MKQINVIFICLSIPLLSIASEPPKKGCLTRLKAGALFSILGSSKLCDAQVRKALIPECPTSQTITQHAQTLTGNTTDLNLASAKSQVLQQTLATLGQVKGIESASEKEARLKNEQALQDLFEDQDMMTQLNKKDAQGNTGHTLLQSKGYQFINGKLHNRYTVQKQRYPAAFGTFLARTNEKELSHQKISTFMKNLHKVYPAFFAKGLEVFDIGFGNGKFSQSLIQSFGKTLSAGTRNMTFAGMDTQEPFAQSTQELLTNIGIAKPKTIVGNFRDDALPKTAIKSANVVIASHFAYVFSDMDQFIEKVEEIFQKDGIAIFLHGGNTPIDLWRQKFSSILRDALTENAPSKIQRAVNKAGLYSRTFAFNPTLKFPQITDRDWKALRTVASNKFDADYSFWNSNRKEAKQLIEFFLQDPLEAFTQQQRHQLVNEFRNLLVSCNNQIPLANSMQIIVARNSDPALKKAVKRAMPKIRR